MKNLLGKIQTFIRIRGFGVACFVGLFIWCDGSFSQPQGPEVVSGDAQTRQDPAPAGKCLSNHLIEARTLNTVRQPLYARMTEGASQGVSKTLILSESLALPFARIMERWARPIARLGVDIFCDVVVSMDGTPTFQAIPKKKDLQNPLRPWKGVGKIFSYLWYGVTLRDEGLAAALSSQQKVLAGDPSTNCMQRHLLESISRAVSFAPHHRQASQQIGYGLRGAVLVQLNILTQISLLPLGFWLDHQAVSIQKQGVPIICGDVPPIPVLSVTGDGSLTH